MENMLINNEQKHNESIESWMQPIGCQWMMERIRTKIQKLMKALLYEIGITSSDNSVMDINDTLDKFDLKTNYFEAHTERFKMSCKQHDANKQNEIQ